MISSIPFVPSLQVPTKVLAIFYHFISTNLISLITNSSNLAKHTYGNNVMCVKGIKPFWANFFANKIFIFHKDTLQVILQNCPWLPKDDDQG